MALLSSRATAEVQSALVIAKNFPRNEMSAFAGIIRACKRKGLAEEAIYSYPKGGSRIEGPSIRLAEVMAQQWGNIECGVVELERGDGESRMMAFAWDLETNTRISKTFTVPHEQVSGTGQTRKVRKLDDERDIYEKAANSGARRLRACILAVIPKDFQDAAVEQCNKTLGEGYKEPLEERVKGMVLHFADEFGVSVEMLETRLGHSLASISETEFVGLKKIYVSLRDGMSTREEWFRVEPQTEVKESKIAPKDKPKKTEAKPAPAPPPQEKAPHPTLAPGDDQGDLLM